MEQELTVTPLYYRRKQQKQVQVLPISAEARSKDSDIMLIRTLARIADHYYFVGMFNKESNNEQTTQNAE